MFFPTTHRSGVKKKKKSRPMMDTMRCVSKPEKGGKEYYKKNWGVLQSFQGE